MKESLDRNIFTFKNFFWNKLGLCMTDSSDSSKFQLVKKKISKIFSYENFICKPDSKTPYLPPNKANKEQKINFNNKPSSPINTQLEPFKGSNIKISNLQLKSINNFDKNTNLNFQLKSNYDSVTDNRNIYANSNDFYSISEGNNSILVCLRFFDAIPCYPKQLIKQGEYFKTRLGSILTILMFILSCFLFYFFGQDFFYLTNPTISYNQYRLTDNKYHNSNFTEDVSLMIALTKKINKASKFVYYTMENNSYFKDAHFSYCTDEQILSYNISKKNSELDYMCIDYKYLIDRANTTTNIYLYLAKCSELPEYNIDYSSCKYAPSINEEEKLRFEFHRKCKKITQDGLFNTQEVIDYYITDKTYNLILTNYQIFTVIDAINFNKLSIDTHPIRRNPITKYFITSSPLANTNALPLRTGNRIRFCNFIIQINQSLIDTQIEYQKFDQMLARVMSMIGLIFFSLKYINNFFSDYFLVEYLKDDLMQYLINEKIDQIFSKQKIQNVSSSIVGLKEVCESEKKINLKNYFTFKNFLQNSFACCSNKLLNPYNVLNEELKYCLSAESFVRFSAPIETDTRLFNSLSNKKFYFHDERNPLLKRLDYISSYDNFFYISGSMTLKTACGGIISILYFFAVIFVIIFFGFNFWSSAIIRVETNRLAIYELNNKTSDLDINFAIAYSKDLDKSTYLYWTNSVKQPMTKNIPFNECTDEEYTRLFSNQTSRDNRLIYICGNINKFISSPYSFYTDKKANFYIEKCSKATDPVVCSNKQIEMDSSKEFFIEIIYEADFLNLSDYTVSREKTRHYATGNFSNLLSVDINLERYLLKRNGQKVSEDNTIKQAIMVQNPIISKSEGFQFKVNFPSYTQTVKSLIYEDISDTIAHIVAIMGIINFIFYKWHLFFFNFFYYKKILKILLRSSEGEIIKYYLLNEESEKSINFESGKNSFITDRIKKSRQIVFDKKMIGSSCNPELNERNNFVYDSAFIRYIENRVFTIGNYLLSCLHISTKQVRDFKKLERKIKDYLSLETLLKKKLTNTNFIADKNIMGQGINPKNIKKSENDEFKLND